MGAYTREVKLWLGHHSRGTVTVAAGVQGMPVSLLDFLRIGRRNKDAAKTFTTEPVASRCVKRASASVR